MLYVTVFPMSTLWLLGDRLTSVVVAAAAPDGSVALAFGPVLLAAAVLAALAAIFFPTLRGVALAVLCSRVLREKGKRKEADQEHTGASGRRHMSHR
jgi:uncharacterized paraquat-inducible protein A